MDLSKIVSAFSLKPAILFAVALATGLALFGPAGFVRSLGLEPAMSGFRPWIGGAFLLSAASWVASMLGGLLHLLRPAAVEHWNARQWRKNLHDLTSEEKVVLSKYLEQGTTTLPHGAMDGVVTGLEAKHVLYRASMLGRPGSVFSFDYNVQPWAWRYLRTHPELLEE